MLTRIVLWTLAALLATAWPAHAQEKYKIAFKQPVKGQTYQNRDVDEEEMQADLVDQDGKPLKELDRSKKASTFAYRSSVLEHAPGARWVAKQQVTYDKAEETSGGKTTALPLQGLTVLVERKGEDYHFTDAKGGALTEAVRKALEKRFPSSRKDDDFDADRAMLPGRPVAVGESWEVDPAPFVKDFNTRAKTGPRITATGMKVTGKLTKVYKKDGRQFGVLEFELVMPIAAYETPDKMKLDVTKESRITVKAHTDRCIDGTRDEESSQVTSHLNMTVIRPDQARVRITAAHQVATQTTEIAK
jgi:hypothetical protein